MEKPLKIVHVISTVILGGAETFVVNLANEQIKTHEVSIITYRNFPENRSQEKLLDPKINLFKIRSDKKFSLKTCYQIYKNIKKLNVDVVHLHLHSSLYYIFIISLFYHKPIYVHTIHNELRFWKKVFDILNILRFINNRIIHICISEQIKKQFDLNYSGFKLFQINNGISPVKLYRTRETLNSDIFNFNIPSNEKLFVMIANLSPAKNHKMIVKVFKQLYDNNIKVHLLVIGEERDLNKPITNEIVKEGAVNVHLLGPKHHAPDFLEIAEAMIIPSLVEGMPIVALEALSLGKPIITTPAGGMVDVVINNYNGLISESFENNEFYNLILQFLSLNQQEKELLCLQAQHSFNKKYHISVVANNYEKIYTLNYI